MKYADKSVGPPPSVPNPERTPCICATTVLYNLGPDAGPDVMGGLHALCDLINHFCRKSSVHVL